MKKKDKMKLHPSILHINAGKLSNESIKLINEMVEKAIKMDFKSHPLNT